MIGLIMRELTKDTAVMVIGIQFHTSTVSIIKYVIKVKTV